MKEKIVLPPKVKGNWWLDLSLFLGGLLATLSGIYFLVLPTGGYQGGRNPYYGIQVLFNRSTWELLHTWSGVAMILVAAVHFAIHWNWVKGTVKLLAGAILRKDIHPGKGNCNNGIVDAILLVSFLLAALQDCIFCSHRKQKATTRSASCSARLRGITCTPGQVSYSSLSFWCILFALEMDQQSHPQCLSRTE